jgi:Uncharacterized conserved protein (COG2071)
MNIPVLQGIIRRRLLVNFRVDPDVIQKSLPAPFRPKVHRGHAIAGLCLIRMEHLHFAGLPPILGLSSENAAHRVAIEWTDKHGESHEGVFIHRRDSDSLLSHLAGGRLFPGVHHPAKFRVEDDGRKIGFAMRSRKGEISVHLQGEEADGLPAGSCFRSLAESSRFFEGGCIGYSPALHPPRLDGMRLETLQWTVLPFAVSQLESSWFNGSTKSVFGAVEFDHALVMRNVDHCWRSVEDLS